MRIENKAYICAIDAFRVPNRHTLQRFRYTITRKTPIPKLMVVGSANTHKRKRVIWWSVTCRSSPNATPTRINPAVFLYEASSSLLSLDRVLTGLEVPKFGATWARGPEAISHTKRSPESFLPAG